jgi:formylglycine-generating enzyme required for sulfatase activity
MLVGVGHHQSVQELLQRLPYDTSDAVLGDSMVSIFATSGAEQKLGRDLFKQALAAVNAMDAPAEAVEEDPIVVEGQRDLRRLLLRLGGLALVITALVLAYLYRPKTEFDLPDRTVRVFAGKDTPLPNLDSLTEIGRVGEYAWPGLAQPGAPAFGRLDTIGGPLVYEASNDTVRDAFTLTLTGTERRVATVKYNIIVTPDTARTQVQRQVEEASDDPPPSLEPDFSRIDPLPHPRSLADLAPVEAKNDGYTKFFYYAWWPLMALIGLLLMTGLYLFLRYQQKQKLRLVAQREQSDGAPHFWRIELPELRAGIDWGENYPALLRQLRRRREDDHRELDINQTISRTIQQGGLPSFHYRAATRPAEYLLLIDRGGANNHHARLFEQLFQQLVAEEVLVERYFYDGDPRLLYQHDRAQSTPLTQLQRRLPNARLLMVGSGDRLIHPATGKLAKWVEPQLGTWASRSILTTLAPSNWGRDERRLAAFFSVLPASMQGLRLLVERINDGNSSEAAIDYRSLVDDAEQAPINLSGSLIGSLQQSFTTPQLQWIAACALYPTLHWDLTLFFGQSISEISNVSPLPRTSEGSRAAIGAGGEVSSEATNLLSSKNLLSLSRLPWFINGSIPPVARHELTEWLQKTYPALHRKLRLAMLAALEQTTPPPAGSVAYRELDFFRLQNEWLLAAPASPERARLAEDLAQRIASGNDPDITVARFMEAPEEGAIVLPQSWNERLYPEGLKGLGVKPEVRKMWWGLPLLALLLAFGWWQHPQLPAEERCEAPVYQITGPAPVDSLLNIQLCDKRDSLILAEHFWQQRIDRAKNIRDLDSLNILDRTHVLRASFGSSTYQVPAITLESLLTLEAQDSFDLQHRENIGAMLWNQGLKLEGDTLTVNDTACKFYAIADSLLGLSAGRKVLLERCQLEALPPDGPEEEVVTPPNPTSDEETTLQDGPTEEQIVIVPIDTPGQPGTVIPIDTPDPPVTPESKSQVPRPQMQTIPAGTFQMGDTFDDKEFDSELPVHAVSLSAFELARYELTFEEYDHYCDSTGVEKPDDRGWGRGRRPVININWFDAVKYCNWLSKQHGYEPVYDGLETEEVTANWAANGYRLPTEAEWEYAARSGGKKHRFGNGKDTLRATEANFDASPDYVNAYSESGEYREKTTTVGTFGRNDSGLADMSGNVNEWCWDWYGYGYYGKSPNNNPKGPGSGSNRVIRGGSWYDGLVFCRASNRYYYEPTYRDIYFGFRLARSSRQGE